ncbi:MAG: sigma-70 family RNA polymerase sigma factor [Verrucomicrobia bacterium]|nr:sigma-70 family RNA polymerase sigma factor [Verrucomicrobiota bacterium]
MGFSIAEDKLRHVATTITTSTERSKPLNYFVTTHWSVVLTAGRHDTDRAHLALEKLCKTYWYPLYAYARRRGCNVEDAQDLTQGFFFALLRRNALAQVDRDKGKFRSFLLASMNHFMSDEWDKVRAQKRDGGILIPLDLASAETRYRQQPADALSPEKLFEKRWAMTLLEQVYDDLRNDYAQEGKAELFEALRFSLMGERSQVPYADLAKRLGMNEGAVKVAVHRIRQCYRKRLRERIAETVATPDEIEDELRSLLRALAD